MVQVRSSRSYSGLPGGGFVTRADTAFDYGQAFQTVLESTEPLLRILDDNRQRALRSFEFDREQTLKRFDLDFVHEAEQTNRFIAGLEYEQKKRDVQFEQFLRIQDLMEKRRDQDEALKAREIQRTRDEEKYQLMQRGTDLVLQYSLSPTSWTLHKLLNGPDDKEASLNRKALMAVNPGLAQTILETTSKQRVRLDDGTMISVQDAFRRLQSNPDSAAYSDQALRHALLTQGLITQGDDLRGVYPGGFDQMERLTQAYTRGSADVRAAYELVREKARARRAYLQEEGLTESEAASDDYAMRLRDEITAAQERHKALLSVNEPARIERAAALVGEIEKLAAAAGDAPLTSEAVQVLDVTAAELAKVTSEDLVVRALFTDASVPSAALDTLVALKNLSEPTRQTLQRLATAGITLSARGSAEAIADRLAGAIPQGDAARFVTVVDQLTNAAQLSDNPEHRDLLNGAAAALIRQIPVSGASGGEGAIEPTPPVASLETTSGIVRGVLGAGLSALPTLHGVGPKLAIGAAALSALSGDAVKAAQEIDALGGPEAALAHFINNRGIGDMPLEVARSMFADLAQGNAPASAAGQYASFKSSKLGEGWGYLTGSRARQTAESEAASSIVNTLRFGVTNNFQNHTADTLASEVRNFRRYAKDPAAGTQPANPLLNKAQLALGQSQATTGRVALSADDLATLWAITGRSDFVVLQGTGLNSPLRVVPIAAARRMQSRGRAESAPVERADASDGATPPPVE